MSKPQIADIEFEAGVRRTAVAIWGLEPGNVNRNGARAVRSCMSWTEWLGSWSKLPGYLLESVGHSTRAATKAAICSGFADPEYAAHGNRRAACCFDEVGDFISIKVLRLTDITHLLMVTTSRKLDKVNDDTENLGVAESRERNRGPVQKWLITQYSWRRNTSALLTSTAFKPSHTFSSSGGCSVVKTMSKENGELLLDRHEILEMAASQSRMTNVLRFQLELASYS